MDKASSITFAWFGLTAGNFIYQWMTLADYGVAVERSFFQLIAMVFAIFVI